MCLILPFNLGTSFSATGNQTNINSSDATKTNFTLSQINNAASRVKNISDTYNIMPNYVEISNNEDNFQITLPQFALVLSEGILKINSGSKTSVTPKNVSFPSATVNNFKSGKIYKSEYVSLAQKIKSFIETNGRAPNYITTSLGKISYEPMVYMYAKIMEYYTANNRLPNYVSISPTNTKRPIYIVSDNIVNNKSDTTRCNALISELKKLGVPVYLYGIGPQYHLKVLDDATIPQNALIVEIAGGSCAASIAEKTGTWYKNLKGNLKVFTLFLSSAVRITGLEWLPRAWDDNYSPKSFTGVSRPDLLLLNNGYNYIEGIPLNDTASMAYFIYKETLT